MKKIILFVSFILLIVHEEVLGQTNLANSVSIYGQLTAAGNPTNLALNGGGFGPAPFNAPGSAGPVIGGSASVMPPLTVTRNGNPIGVVTASSTYPVNPMVDADIEFFGSFSGSGTYEIRYAVSMEAPAVVTHSPATPTQICATASITLSSANNWPLKPSDGIVTTSVVWEYRIKNTTVWKGLDTSSGYTRTFIPALHIPEVSTVAQDVQFRCKQKAQYSDRTYYSDYSQPSGYRTIIPAPPQLDTTQKVITPSCFGLPTGKFYIPRSAITSSFPTLRWMLKAGNVTTPCDPALGNCGVYVDQSNGAVGFTNGITSTVPLPGGIYTLWVYNAGPDAGNCIAPISIIIPQLTALTITKNVAQTTNVLCYGSSDGKIGVTAAGGNGAASGYFFTLKDINNVVIRSEQRATGATMQWTNLPANKYKVEVRDGTCSKVEPLEIELTQPNEITGALTVTQPTCSSTANGIIKVTASADAPNHYYNLYKGGVSQGGSGSTASIDYTFNNLNAGSYYVLVGISGCGGRQTNTVVLNPASPLSVQFVSVDSVSCNGGSDGKLKVSGSGGSGSYQYTLGAVTNTTGLFTGLSTGSYTITVKNQGAGCTDAGTGTFSVPQRKPIQVSLQKTDIICNAANNGVIKATVKDGSGAYQYTWQQLKAGVWTGNSFWFSTDTQIEGLGPGTYRVIISDAKSAGCKVTSGVVTLAEPTPVIFTNIKVTDAVCLAEGASVGMTASGGSGNYIYKWSLDGGTTFTGFTNGGALHTAGTYTFSVTDGTGCTAISPATYKITLPDAALSFTTQLSTYNGFNISCSGASDGRIEVNANGGDHNYQYKLNNGVYQSAHVFEDLAAGNYTVTVKDGRGCVQSTAIILTQPAIKIKAVKKDISCYGTSSGSIITNITGGAAPYTCLLNGVTVKDTILNLPAGDYTLHITDANGCSVDSLISIIHVYPALNIQTAVVSDIVCYGTTGSIALATTGGDGTYQYNISSDDWTTETTYTSAAALAAGNYSIRVTDGQGCTDTYADHLLITSPSDPLAFTATLSDYNGYNISCSGGDNGFARIQATGGSSVYKYALDSGTYGDSSLIEHINAGSHILSVKDTRGCIVSSGYTFTQSAQALDIVLVSKADVICAVTPAGNITVAGSGGAGSLQYSIDNNKWQSGTSFYNLVAGNYTIQVKDVNSCSIGLPVQINSQDPAIVIDKVTLNDIVCYDSKGTISVQAHGGAGALISEYALNGGAYTSFNNTTPLGAGTYQVRVKDAPGCYSAIVDVGIITSPVAPLTATVTTSDFNGVQISCNGLADGTVAVAATGGAAGYQYSFNNEAYTGINSYDHLPAGTYPLKIKDNRGCVLTKNVVMQQSAAVTLAVAGIEDLSCGADPTGKIILQAVGGVIPYQYDLGDGKWQDMPVFPSLMEGRYQVQVKDINGCMAANNANVKALDPAITAEADITPVNCYGEGNGAVKVNMAGGDGHYTYLWNVAGIAGANPQHLPAGNYTLKVTDGKGCFKSFSYAIQQPDLLTLATTAPAVCDGLSDGRITAAAQGGITPYQYTLDQGVWGITPVFEHMTAGNYKVTVQDANGCKVSKELVIEKINIKPDVNFLVASRKNALDTLVIREISLPAPDKVSWTYSPDAILLGDGLIKFSKPGNYWVQMTATFGSCTYSLKKDLLISEYDPLAGPIYAMPVHVIDTLTLSPNPNNGYFSFQVKMIKKQQVIVNVYDMNGRLVDSKQYPPSLLINDTFSLGNTISGTYLLRVIAENDSRDIRFIISK